MTLKELKDFLGTLTEEQLQQPVYFFHGDDTDGMLIDSWEVSTEDIYWERHGDCLGNIEQAKKLLKQWAQNWEQKKDDLVVVPKGSVTFHSI